MKFLYFFPIITLSFGCVQKNKIAAEYFENYFRYQDSIRKDFKEGSVSRILYGNPEPSDENEFVQTGDSLTMGMRLVKEGQIYRPDMLGFAPTVTPEAPYGIFVEARKHYFREHPIYKIKRVTEMISPELSVIDVLPHIESFLDHIRNPLADDLTKVSVLQEFLCANLECDMVRDEKAITLSYTLSSKTKENFPLAYQKYGKRLEQAAFRLQLFQPGGFSSGWEIYNEGKTIYLNIPASPKGYWAKPKSIHARFYLTLSTFGLKIEIRGLGYSLRFVRSPKTDSVSGQFTKIPETKVGGRFLSIFPPGFVNIFIPGNMQEYFENYFELLVNGSEGNGGSKFVSITHRNGRWTKVTLTSQSEILRERFLPFRSKEEEDSPSFVSEFERAVVQDLGGKK
ncbi:putative lipoprotein [Leptospira broomii serovar Hurstbridge str. 5399]|uniref:Lipoprotein n=1 Tax=Leptospira broomii serovar Hurstbridge str. 5399 TaxID=1049789 RepID=T0F9N9_9LEPT|nr:hypothetical protein [Leptospira broomii]EQA44586.1 putative lipoprotein [Leptospira broomii serovar Hurstbridge str. 5399]